MGFKLKYNKKSGQITACFALGKLQFLSEYID